MFKNNFQGGSVVEIFSAQGKDPVAKWRLQGAPASINKVFDKEVKGFVYCVEGCSQTVKMQIPEDGKTTLGLLQRFLVLQRLYLSTVHKEFSATPLHARIPFVSLKQNIWSNLCIDLVSFTEELFKTATFQTLDGIAVCANCKLRRIYTMKAEPADSSDGGILQTLSTPRQTCPELNAERMHAAIELQRVLLSALKHSWSLTLRKRPGRSSEYRACLRLTPPPLCFVVPVAFGVLQTELPEGPRTEIPAKRGKLCHEASAPLHTMQDTA
ncbi:hypothetical protein NHX12_031040 [Muraenolepis orangiensis]|uniref:CFA20 domain-containing protein n=1 Tax=Muraenolepis orangiensis TaxID=630683 RepID=A0A9Q0IMF0_9TELE|nr:hypothetical protein NHX12_031040 [Muraenolepis orangiensis]